MINFIGTAFLVCLILTPLGFLLYVLYSVLRNLYESYQDRQYFKSSEGLAAQKKCDDYNNGPGKIIREANELLRIQYGHYAVTDELPMTELRQIITRLSDIGYDLKRIMPGHGDKFIAYLTFNFDR